MNNVSEILKKIPHNENAIYRGHADSEWKLIPSIGRQYSGIWKEVLESEKKSLEQFKKRSIPFLKYNPNSDIEWLCLMQHHGCATRLLDFTINPLIALFFATGPPFDKDGDLIIAQYDRSYDNVSDDKLFERTHNFAYFPPHIAERIIGQFGCFLYSADPPKPLGEEKQVSKIKIKKRFKNQMRSELKILGISQATLFPGLDGICQDINDALVLNILYKELGL